MLGSPSPTLVGMCRNITTLRGLEPVATPDEVEAAARQSVRKVSGVSKPSAAPQAAFERAVAEIARAPLAGVHAEGLIGLLSVRKPFTQDASRFDEAGRLLDPWGRPYRYARVDPQRFDLSCDGDDGVAATADDVSLDEPGP